MRVSLTISLLTLALLIACAPSPRGQSNSELSRPNVAIEKLAIVPFLKVSNDASLREGAAIVERHFAELLSKQVLLIILGWKNILTPMILMVLGESMMVLS